ncbi:MAG: hypothetical protein JST00_16510 [Deltaproteobacteria bacterium]|nr:hypothetical protein [Deltaproteobacteria bacterium]
MVDRREDSRTALAVTTFAASALLLLLLDDIVKLRLLPGPGGFAYTLVTFLIALAAVGPWLAWTRRGDVGGVVISPGRVVAGGTVLTTEDVTAIAVAEGARGRSVAIARQRGNVTFLEVEREEEARAIAAALGRKPEPSSTLALPRHRRALAFFQLLVSSIGLACAPLYYLAATAELSSQGKGIFGVGGVLASLVGAALLAARHASRSQAVALRRGAYDRHVELHRAAPSTREGQLDEEARSEATPGLALSRGNEPLRAWLARLDALPNEAHAYRGDAMKKDVLWGALSDEASPLEVRMGAARVLARRHGEAPATLVRVVTDPDERVRVEAALDEEEEEAERRIERLGPLFRAR